MEFSLGIRSYVLIGILLILGALGQGQQVPYGTRTTNRNRLVRLTAPNSKAHANHPKIINLETVCFPEGMSVTVDFDQPFAGVVYSKGFFGSSNCRFVQGNSAGTTQLSFGVPANDCGTKENKLSKSLSNVLIFQMDEDVQEIWDISRKASCSNAKPGDTHEKMVVFKPLSVGMLDVQHHPITDEDLDCWMDIQVGKYPNISPVQGQIPIGEELSILIFLKDAERQYDVRVKDCWAFDMDHFEDSKTSKVQLTEYDGCPRKVKLIGSWEKTLDTGSSGATIIAFTNMTAFKFPDSDNVHLTCNVELCRGVCAQNTCGIPSQITASLPRGQGQDAPGQGPRGQGQDARGQGSRAQSPDTRVQGQDARGPGQDTRGQGSRAQSPDTRAQGQDARGPGRVKESSPDEPSNINVTPYPGQRYTVGPQPQRPGSATSAPSRQAAQDTTGRPPFCYEGSFDPRCRGQSAPQNVTQEVPDFAGVCPPGSLNPECLEYPVKMDLETGQEDDPSKGIGPQDESEADILGAGQVPTTSDPGQYFFPTTRPPPVYSATSPPARTPLCYPGQPDPRCPGSYPQKSSGPPTGRPQYNTYPPQTSTKTPTQNGYPGTPTRRPDTVRPFLCYPGQIDPRCPKTQTPSTPDENEDLTDPEGYTPTQSPFEDGKTTVIGGARYPSSSQKPFRCTPGSTDSRCTVNYTTMRYDSEDDIGNGVFTTTAVPPYQQYSTRGPSTDYPQPISRLPSSTDYTRPDTRYPSPNTGYTQPDTRYPSPNAGYPRPDSRYPSPTTGERKPDSRYPSPPTDYTRPDSRYPSPSTDDRRPDSRYPSQNGDSKPDSRYPSPTDYPRPDSRYPSPSTDDRRPDSRFPSQNGDSKPDSRYPTPTDYPRPDSRYTTTTKQPTRYQPTTQKPRVQGTTRKVLCYPGQPDPRCPGSYPSKAPDYTPDPKGALYDIPTPSTTLRPYIPTPSRKTPPSQIRTPSTTPKPVLCYQGSRDPRCQSYSTTLSNEAEDAGSFFGTTPKPYQTPAKPKSPPGTNQPYDFQSTPQSGPGRYPSPTTTPRPRVGPTTTKRPVLCYPGQRDPRCPPPAPVQQPSLPGTDDEEVVHNEFETDVQDAQKQPRPFDSTTIALPPSLFEPPTTTSRPGYQPRPNGYEPSPNGYTPKPNGYQPRPSGYEPQPNGYPAKTNGYEPRPNGYTPKPNGYEAKPDGYTYNKPNGYEPRPSGYTPKPNGFEAKPDGYTPKPNGYETRPSGYTPKPNGYEAKPDGYTPKPNGYEAKPDGYTPKPNGYEAKPDGYTPKPNGYESRPSGYPPKPNGYEPRPDGVTPKPNGYEPRPDEYTPKPNGYESRPSGYTPKPNGYEPRPSGYTPKPNGYEPKPNGYEPRPPGYQPKPNVNEPVESQQDTQPAGYRPKPNGNVPEDSEQQSQPNGYQPKPNGSGGRPSEYQPRPSGYDQNGQPAKRPNGYEPKAPESKPSGSESLREPEKGYVYKPPSGRPFNYDIPSSTNGDSRPVVCYPGLVDPRCPKVCYEGSTDRRCTRKREVSPNQLICFADSTDPRCPKFT